MYLCNPNRGVEQQVARRAHNPKVAGSSPVPATTRELRNKFSFFVPKNQDFTFFGKSIINS